MPLLARRWAHAATCLLVAALAGCTAEPPADDDVSLVVSNVTSPRILGEPVVGTRLRVSPVEWTRAGVEVATSWSRDGRPTVAGTSYVVTPADVGHRIEVRVRPVGRFTGDDVRVRSAVIRHPASPTDPAPSSSASDLPPIDLVVTYRVRTAGAVSEDVESFADDVAGVLRDPRGWRRGGVSFVRDDTDADFTLYLAEARLLPTFSSTCSPTYSCRVGDSVIINDTPWTKATPAWTGAGAQLASYRQMVLTHEVGHWLRVPHQPCGTPGRRARVMQQQSKSMLGCTPNPWPLDAEIAIARSGPRF